MIKTVFLGTALLATSASAGPQQGRLLADEGAAARKALLAGTVAKDAGDRPPAVAQLPAVSSGVDLTRYLVPAWGTGAIPAKDVDVGAFRFLCAPGQLSYDDPIVYPGRRGASHLHQFFGNTGATAASTYQSLRTSGDSTCNNVLNRSAYWIPAMMNGAGKVVKPDYVSIYYKRMPSSDPRCHSFAKACVAIPRGLRYVFGFNMQDPRRSAPATARWWNCDGPGAVSGHFATIPEAARNCPVGARLGGELFSPDCWNGKDLDSPDHRSHVVYTVQNGRGQAVCPASHPFIIPQFTLAAWYTNDGTAGAWFLSSDRMPGMKAMTAGSTLHSDWFGAWEDKVLERWTANCIDKLLSCSGGDLGDGRQLKTLAGYTYPNKTVLVEPPPRPAG